MTQLWVSTVELTCFFTLLGLAYALVLEGAGLFNFAIGEYAMISGLAGAWLMVEHDMDPLQALPLGLLIAAVFAAITELVIVRPIQKRTGHDEMPALVAVVGAMAALDQYAGFQFGRLTLPGRPLIKFDAIKIGDARVMPHVVILLIATVVVSGGVAVWRLRSRTGRLLRAVGDNEDAARLLGLPVGRVRVTAFILAGVVAGLAGALFAPKAGVNNASGLTWTLLGFLVLVIGGRGSMIAPLVGGFVLAMISVWAPYYFGSASTDYVIAGLAFAFFAVRPVGIFAPRVRT